MRAAADGFTLIETLVAMAILAVVSGGLIHAAEAHIDLVTGLQQRLEGGWAADNALAEERVGIVDHDETILGHRWHVSVVTTPSEDHDVVSLALTASSGRATVKLKGFRDRSLGAAGDLGRGGR